MSRQTVLLMPSRIILRGSPDVPSDTPPDLFLFTPQLADDEEIRIKLWISKEDMAKVKRGHWQAEVTDVPTGQRFIVEGAPCGLGCMCAARIVQWFPSRENDDG